VINNILMAAEIIGIILKEVEIGYVRVDVRFFLPISNGLKIISKNEF
jgi:hypothetical protein